MKTRHTCGIRAIPCVAAFSLIAASIPANASVASDIEDLTGSRTKIVWCHAVNSGQGEPVEEFQPIKAFDTDEGTERILVPNSDIHFNPIITPGGNEVVYNEGVQIGGDNGNGTLDMGMTRAVKWDGTGGRDIGPGIPVFVWKDPATNHEWVYVSSPGGNGERYDNSGPIIRYRLSDPLIHEIAYQPGYNYTYYIGMSADGTRMGGQMTPPNPDNSHGIRIMQDPAISAPAGLFPNPVFASYETGFCSSNFASDNSYYYMHYDHCHCAVFIYNSDMQPITYNDTEWGSGDNSKYIWIQPWVNQSDPIPDDNKTWSLKWANNPRFLTVSGQSIYSRDSANIYIGRFSASMTRVEKWVRVTNSIGFETHSYAWIAPGGTTSVLDESSILTPVEGDTFQLGDTIAITWQFGTGPDMDVAVELTYDNGIHWRQISGQSILGSQEPVYKWVAPETHFVAGLGQVPITGIPLIVRVREYTSDRIAGISGAFTILASNSISGRQKFNARKNEAIFCDGKFIIAKPGVSDIRIMSADGKLLFAAHNIFAGTRARIPSQLAAGMYLFTCQTRTQQQRGCFLVP